MRSIAEVEAGVGVPHAQHPVLHPHPSRCFASLATRHPPRKGEGEENHPFNPAS
jgi:hypothetical protein